LSDFFWFFSLCGGKFDSSLLSQEGEISPFFLAKSTIFFYVVLPAILSFASHSSRHFLAKILFLAGELIPLRQPAAAAGRTQTMTAANLDALSRQIVDTRTDHRPGRPAHHRHRLPIKI